MTSSISEGEVRTILNEWTQAALRTRNLDIPVADSERRLRALPGVHGWAVSDDALAVSLLGQDDTLYTLAITEDGEMLSTHEWRLTGERISIQRDESPARRYRDTETVRDTRWIFKYMNGETILSLTGRVWTDRQTGNRRPDPPQILAEAFVALAERNATGR